MDIENKLNDIGINLKKGNSEIKRCFDILEEMNEARHKGNLNRYIEFHRYLTNLKIYDSKEVNKIRRI